MPRRPLGPRARVRTRTKDGELIHELLIYPDRAGPARAVRFPTRAEAERQCQIALAELDAGTLDAPADWPGMIDAYLSARPGLRRESRQTYRHRLEAVARTFPSRDPLTLASSGGTEGKANQASGSGLGSMSTPVSTGQHSCLYRAALLSLLGSTPVSNRGCSEEWRGCARGERATERNGSVGKRPARRQSLTLPTLPARGAERTGALGRLRPGCSCTA